MKYDLAKELKDAGFPLNPNRQWERSDFAWLPSIQITKQEREKLWIPTLEELIEACGDGFDGLYLQHGSWAAIGGGGNGDVKITQVVTPTEAVARLWLALNKN